MNEADAIRQTLTHANTIAVVGLSPDPNRDSHSVARAMQSQGYRILPVNPRANVAEILGEPVFESLAAAAEQHKIDVVDCFRNSAAIPAIVDEAIAIGAKAVWMQLGVSHAVAARKAEAAGLRVVQNKCIKIEHGVLQARGWLAPRQSPQ